MGAIEVFGESGVTKKHQKFIFEYWVFSQKSYLNVWCFEKFHICIPLYTMCFIRSEKSEHQAFLEKVMNSRKGFEPN